MKKNEIKVGANYLAKVSDRVVPVRIDAESRHGGWDATNLVTDKKVRIKSAHRLRCPANRDGSPQAKAEVEANAAKDDPKAGKKAKAAAGGQAKGEKLAKAKKATANGAAKMSQLDAAAKVLSEHRKPMNCKDMVAAMATKKYWTSPGGKTPHATLSAAILREMTVKKNEARFKKAGRGLFAIKGVK